MRYERLGVLAQRALVGRLVEAEQGDGGLIRERPDGGAVGGAHPDGDHRGDLRQSAVEAADQRSEAQVHGGPAGGALRGVEWPAGHLVGDDGGNFLRRLVGTVLALLLLLVMVGGSLQAVLRAAGPAAAVPLAPGLA